MTKRYLSLRNPRTRTRLQGEIFNGISVAVYGADTDRLEREERFNSVRTAIVHLMHHQHYPGDVHLAEGIAEIRDAHDELMAHPDAENYFGKQRIARLKRRMGQLISTTQECVNPAFAEADIQRFFELCLKGRVHYETQGYDPEAFIPGNIVAFVALINGNFQAYRATLNHAYI